MYNKSMENTETKTKIMVVLNNGDSFVYGGEKTIEQIKDFMIWKTPATIMVNDENGNTHLFHSNRVNHIYTFNS
jgi:hypothetical protein